MLKTKAPSIRPVNGRDAAVKVLIVEDDAQVRQVMEETFSDEGYEVDAVDSVAHGLELVGSRDFDIIVADGRLGDGTGMEIADVAWERDIPTLIVTAYAFDLIHEKWNLASYNIIQKPVRPAQLVMAVTALLKLQGR